MNSVVLKGKLGAGFNDDRYTLPKDGNPGDILVKTETGSAWEKQEPATSTPDWNQNDATASDYIKNKPYVYNTNRYANTITTRLGIAFDDTLSKYGATTLLENCSALLVKEGGTSIADRVFAFAVSNTDGVSSDVVRLSRNYVEFQSRQVTIRSSNDSGINDVVRLRYSNNNGRIFVEITDKAALVIPSSTSGSTKKFKITVDDSGTLSATEVT